MPRLMLKPVLKISSIVAFLAALGLFFWWTMRVPTPRESDRISHRDGAFSIIKPRDWEVIFNYSPNDRKYIDFVEIRLPTTRPRDRRIFIGRLREAPDLERDGAPGDKLVDTQFQDRPARVYQGKSRLEFYWRALFEREGQWYEMVWWTLLPEDVADTGWWAYLQSFRAGTPTTASRVSG